MSWRDEPDPRELRQKAGRIHDRISKIVETAKAARRDLTGSEAAEFDQGLKDIDALKIEAREIELKEQLAVERIANDPNARICGGDDGGLYFTPRYNEPVFERSDSGVLPDTPTACQDYVKRNRDRFGSAADPQYDDLTFGQYCRALIAGPKTEAERRALSEGTDSAGGHLVPTVLHARLIDLLRAKLVIARAGAQFIPLETDQTIMAKTASDPVAAWRAEAGAVAESDPTFTAVTFAPKSLAVRFKASRELAEDAPNFSRTIETQLAQSFARQLDAAALEGVGSTGNQPLGIFSSTSVNVVSMGTNGARPTNWNPFLDGLKELEIDNVDIARVRAIMHPRTRHTFATLSSTADGQPLQRPPDISNLPFDVTTAVSIDQTQGTSTDASSIYMGAFDNLMVGVRHDLRVQVLQERYSENLQIGFLGYARWDVQFAHPEAFVKVVGLTT